MMIKQTSVVQEVGLMKSNFEFLNKSYPMFNKTKIFIFLMRGYNDYEKRNYH